MPTSSFAAALLLVAFFALEAAAAPGIPAECHPGKDPHEPGATDYPGGLSDKGHGPTPVSLPGAVTISAAEAKCLIDKLGDKLTVIAAVEDKRQLPGAFTAPWAASNDTTGKVQSALVEGLRALSGGDRQWPVITYCHHTQCFLSYNVALRLVQAGYTNVFWFRPGIIGWEQAGFAFAPVVAPARPAEPPLPPVPQGLTPAYLRDVKDDAVSDYDVEDYVSLLVQVETAEAFARALAQDLGRLQRGQRDHLNDVKRRFAGNAAAVADIDQRLATADADVAAHVEAVRATFEGDPATHLSHRVAFNDVSQLQQWLAFARAMQPKEQRCGTFDFSQPPMVREVVDRREDERLRYARCLERFRDDTFFRHAKNDFERARRTVLAVDRFTCSRRPHPNCFPDGPWKRLADVATPANVRIVEAAEELGAWRNGVNAEIVRLNEWTEELSERIRQHNAR